jgi:hypothetical protein
MLECQCFYISNTVTLQLSKTLECQYFHISTTVNLQLKMLECWHFYISNTIKLQSKMLEWECLTLLHHQLTTTKKHWRAYVFTFLIHLEECNLYPLFGASTFSFIISDWVGTKLCWTSFIKISRADEDSTCQQTLLAHMLQVNLGCFGNWTPTESDRVQLRSTRVNFGGLGDLGWDVRQPSTRVDLGLT